MNIIITGVTKGIGRATALRFAAEGANLALCARNLTDLEQLQQEITLAYPNCEVLIQSVDMRKKDEINLFAKNILKKWKNIDVLINNAGVFIGSEMMTEADDVLEIQMETNVYSAYYLTKAIVPAMLGQKSGHIFNLCSIASIRGLPNCGSYSISKFALLGFTKALREELKEKGIKVTAILPGATWSHSWEGVDLPKERLMPASDIAEAIYGAYNLSKIAVVEELLIRPQLGDL